MSFLENLPSFNRENFSLVSPSSKMSVDSAPYIPTYETNPAPGQSIASEPSNLLLRYLTQRFEMQHLNTSKGAKRNVVLEEPAERLPKRPTGPPEESMTM